MKHYKAKRGYNIPLEGAAEKTTRDAARPASFSVHPARFHNLKARLLVKEGDDVRIGTPLFEDKKNPGVYFVSPAAGKVSQIEFGPRRVVNAIRIEGASDDAVQHQSFRPGEIKNANREDLVKHLCEGGAWVYIRQRPFDIIARPDVTPSSIFVNCMDTAPHAAEAEFALQGKLPEFEAGLEALGVLSGGKVHVVVDGNRHADSQFSNVKGDKIEIHSYAGKHPAGLVSTHIEAIDPIINTEHTIWYLNARDVVQLGAFLLVGQFSTDKTVVVTGAGATNRQYFKTRLGASIESIVGKDVINGELRYIAGNILTGKQVEPEEALGYHDDQITIVSEGHEQHFIGWMLPGFGKPSWSRAFMSAIIPGRTYTQNTNQNGEHRALVKTGDYRKVTSLDILPAQLVKSILAEDIEQMEQLGILEVAPEDVALCSYICPSKTEFTEIVQAGLDLMQAELS